MIRRFARLAAAVLCTATLASCGNMSIGLGSYTYKGIHLYLHSPQYAGIDREVMKWYEADTGIEVEIKGYGHVFISEGNYMLIPDVESCPICDVAKED